MPDTLKPVTLGDLQVRIPQGDDATGWWDYRPATVADLVSALRAEGVLVVERVDGKWPYGVVERACAAYGQAPVSFGSGPQDAGPIRVHAILDALAEAQPFPPAGGVS